VQGTRVEVGEVEKAEGTPAASPPPSAPAARSEDRGGRSDDRGNRSEDRGRRSDRGNRRPESQGEEAAAAGAPGQPLPSGQALIDRIAPMMRRNRRGAGISGSTSFLARALKCSESELVTAFNGLGLTLPTDPNAEPATVEIGDGVWWLNQDNRGGVWINGREKSDDRQPPAPSDHPAPEASRSGFSYEVPSAEGPAGSADTAAAPLTAVRLLLKPTKTGAFADAAGRLAEALGKSVDEFLSTLMGAGLKVPEKAREKPVFVEHAGEIFWLNKSAKDELWLNAKPSKFAEDGSEKRGSRSRGKKSAEVAPADSPAEEPAAPSDPAS
jgi:hypothetical protein